MYKRLLEEFDNFESKAETIYQSPTASSNLLIRDRGIRIVKGTLGSDHAAGRARRHSVSLIHRMVGALSRAFPIDFEGLVQGQGLVASQLMLATHCIAGGTSAS